MALTLSTNLMAQNPVAPTVGGGTEASPWEIANLNNLAWLQQSSNFANWDKYYIQTADIDASATSGWNSNVGFSPIGNEIYKFTGNYNGQNHVISNLFMNRKTEGETCHGFFGNTQVATIQNLGLENVLLKGFYIGALIGYAELGSVQNCWATGSVEGDQYTGGLIGTLDGDLSDSYFSGTVVAVGPEYGAGFYAGGLVGYVGYENDGHVSNSYSQGSVDAESWVGGLVGYGDAGTIENSYSTSTVISKEGYDCGGFMGFNEAVTITNCYSAGLVSCYGSNVGGFIGYKDPSISIDDCFWDTETSGLLVSDGGTGKTTADMKTLATFTDVTTTGLTTAWDFISNPNDDTGDEDYWDIDGTDNNNNGYPFLSWQKTSVLWDGSSSTDWNIADNWTRSLGVPSSPKNVTIPNNVDNYPIINVAPASPATCNNLTLNSDASLTINAGKALTVEGNLTVAASKAAATMTFNSDASGTGSLIVSGTSSGNVIFKRYVDEATKAATWHYVSAPVAGQNLDVAWMGAPNSIAQSGEHYQFFCWDEPTNYWIIYGNDLFVDATFVDARGYCLTRDGAGELSFTGTVRTSDVNYLTSYTTGEGVGFNLVGNPFTSAIGVTSSATTTGKFLATNATLLDDSYEALYIWDEQTGYNGSRNDYKIISNGAIGGYTRILQDYIQPGQAFMVKVVSGGGTLAFNENMQAHASINYKNTKESWPSVELIVENNELFNSTAIGFNENMTPGLDPSYDVGKMKGNPKIALYTRLIEDNGIDFAIQALPFSGLEELEIPVGIDILETAIFEFSAKQEKLDNYNVVLEDRQENTFTNLRWNTYFAEISESGTGRFFLHFKDATAIGEVLPQLKISCFAHNGKLVINNPENQKGVVSVTNLTGQQLFIDNLSGSENQEIKLALTTGIYIVYFQTEISKTSKKIYIN